MTRKKHGLPHCPTCTRDMESQEVNHWVILWCCPQIEQCGQFFFAERGETPDNG